MTLLSYHDKRRYKEGPVEMDEKVLMIKGVVLFGGGEVKN